MILLKDCRGVIGLILASCGFVACLTLWLLGTYDVIEGVGPLVLGVFAVFELPAVVLGSMSRRTKPGIAALSLSLGLCVAVAVAFALQTPAIQERELPLNSPPAVEEAD